MGAGGGWAYRWLTGYLPKRMVNQMKELSSIAYTWWAGGQSTCPSSSGGSLPPGEGAQGGPITPRPAPPCSLCRASPAGPQDPGGRGRGGGESYREGEAQADQGGDDVPVHPQEALDPPQAVLGRGQRVRNWKYRIWILLWWIFLYRMGMALPSVRWQKSWELRIKH